MTGNAHKESCLKLLVILILVGEKGLYISKVIVVTKWWLLSQLKKKLFIGRPIFRCGAAAFLFIFVVLSCWFSCSICLISGIATKVAIALYIQFYKLFWLWFYVDFFIKLGFYYNAVE